MRAVEGEVLKANGDWSKAKGAVRSALEGLSGRIEKVYQAEAQLGSQLERLQEEAIAVRARPATLLTKPLEAFTEATARQQGRQIQLQVSGDDMVVDHDMLEELRPHLRTLIEFCLSQSTPQRISADKSKSGKLSPRPGPERGAGCRHARRQRTCRRRDSRRKCRDASGWNAGGAPRPGRRTARGAAAGRGRPFRSDPADGHGRAGRHGRAGGRVPVRGAAGSHTADRAFERRGRHAAVGGRGPLHAQAWRRGSASGSLPAGRHRRGKHSDAGCAQMDKGTCSSLSASSRTASRCSSTS